LQSDPPKSSFLTVPSSSTDKEPTGLLSLPDEILDEVTSYLYPEPDADSFNWAEDTRDLRSFVLVNKRLARIASHRVWGVMRLTNQENDENILALYTKSWIHKHIHTLSWILPIHPSAFASILLPLLPCLTSLSLFPTSYLPFAFIKVLKQLPLLRSLTLCGISVRHYDGTFNLGQFAPHLRSIEITSGFGMTAGAGDMPVLLDGFESLEVVKLPNMQLSGISLLIVPRLLALREIEAIPDASLSDPGSFVQHVHQRYSLDVMRLLFLLRSRR
jgi:hypothetical protein